MRSSARRRIGRVQSVSDVVVSHPTPKCDCKACQGWLQAQNSKNRPENRTPPSDFFGRFALPDRVVSEGVLKIPGVTFLTPHERGLLAAVADTLLPPTDLLNERADEVAVAQHVENHVGHCSRQIRATLRLALRCFDLQAFFRYGCGFLKISRDEREECLVRWRRSSFYPRRLLYKLLESNCNMVYYADSKIAQKVGFVTPPADPALPLPPFTADAEQDQFFETDVCVIGSGAGGAVVARELAEKGRSVLLLEEGDIYGLKDFGREAVEIVERIYHNAGMQMTLGAPCIILPTGRAVGGTTLINSGTCFRVPDKILKRWQNEFGLKALTSESLTPFFDRVEKRLHVSPVTDAVLGNNSKIFQRGLRAMGLEGFPLPRNAKGCNGSGMCCFGCPTDAKQSVNLSYVPQAVAAGAKLFVRCRAEKIIPKQGHGGEIHGHFLDALGLPKRKIHISAKSIVLAAGTLQTPYLLKKSGIAMHNRHVGRHLTIHPTGKIIGLFDEKVRAWEGVPQGYGYDGFAEEGTMFEGAFTPPSFASVNLGLPPMENKRAMENYERLASFGFLISDEARGFVRWMPGGEPLIFYSIQKKELQRYLKGIRFLCEVFFAAGAKEIYTGLKGLPTLTPETGLKPFDDFDLHRTDLEIAAFHPLGTCRMAADSSEGVVDSSGEVHGIRNLFIADGSIFPSSLGVNPQEAIMAFATRTAEFIHKNRL